MSVEVKVNGEWRKVAGGTLYADAPVGTISAYGGETAPSGWLLCQGQAVSRTTYAELFKAIGTSFGTGDGSTTFNLPDLRETVPVGSGTRGSGVTAHDTYSVGTFKDDQLQDHRHYRYTERRNGWNIGVGDEGVTEYGRIASNSENYDNGNYIGEVYNGRRGTTTHGKQLGVNYIIKAVQSAVPADIAAGVDEQIADKQDKLTVTSGSAVLASGILGAVTYRKYGRVVQLCINNIRNDSSGIAAGATIATGLPEPADAIPFSIGMYPNATDVTDITSGGVLRQTGMYSVSAGIGLFGTVSYIAKE